MIISKAPLRMSFVGGGSDMRSFYKENGGAVVSTAIDKYVYITVNKNFDNGIKLKYSRSEDVENASLLEHRLAAEIFRYTKLNNGLEVSSLADVPSKGTGLGSSSSFSVAMLHALHTYKQEYVSAEQLAREACEIEIELLGEPIGKQDQYAAAYGGFNCIRFNSDESVTVSPIICKQDTRRALQGNLLLFYTGITRSASGILAEQNINIAKVDKTATMKKMVGLANDLCEELRRNNVSVFGEILHENWLLKKQMASGVSTARIDGWYELAMKAGATGGKLLGAGGGGFLLFYVPQDRHEDVKSALSELRFFPFKFEPEGSRVIFIHE